jgi:IclR family transcriptional regulator, acetate operon repressor
VKTTPGNGNATEKVLAVLQALADNERIADISGVTGLPKSTVHRILQSLVEHRFALNAGDGHYIGGPRILTLAGRLLGRFDPAQHADGTLRRLREDTGYTVHFGLLAGDDVVYAAKVEGKKPYRMPSRIGMSVRLHTTAIGKAILATMTDEAVSAIMGRTGMEARTPGTITSVPALLEHLTSIRTQGYSLDEEENEPGIRCIGAAVHDHTGRATGAVSISTLALEPWDRPLADLAARVRVSAREISESLGHLPARPAVSG